MKSLTLFTIFAIIAAAALLAFTTSDAAPVLLYGGDFIDLGGKPLAGYAVTHEETGMNYTLNATGWLEIDLPIGSNVTFTLHGDKHYHTTQTATSTVPVGGLAGEYTTIALQVPDTFTFDLLNAILPHKHNWSECQVVVTVCNYMVNWESCPQGFNLNGQGIVAHMSPPRNQDIYYFGTWGKLSNKTNPLPNKLTSSSWDGGVFFENVPFGEYIITANYGSVPFSPTRIKCMRPGLINGAPNQGPRAQAPLTNLPCPNNC